MNPFHHVYNSGQGEYHVPPTEYGRQSYDQMVWRGYPPRGRQMSSGYNQTPRESMYDNYDPRERNQSFPLGSYSGDFERLGQWNSNNQGNYENRGTMRNYRDNWSSERGCGISERCRNSQRGYGISEGDRISQRDYGISGRDVDSQTGYGISERGRNSNRGHGILDRGNEFSKGGNSNYMESGTCGGKRPYWKAEGPDTRSNQIYEESLQNRTQSGNFQRQLGDDFVVRRQQFHTVPSRTFPRGSPKKKPPRSNTLRYPEMKGSTAQEMSKTNYVKETTDRASSGSTSKTAGKVQKQKMLTFDKSVSKPLSTASVHDKKITKKTDKPDFYMGFSTSEKDNKQSAESTVMNKNMSGTERRLDFTQINDTSPVDMIGAHRSKLMEAFNTQVTVIEAGTRDKIAVDSSKTMSSGEQKNETGYLEGLSALTLTSGKDEDVHTKSIAKTEEKDGDCVVEVLASKTPSLQKTVQPSTLSGETPVTAAGCSTVKGPVTSGEQIRSVQTASVHDDLDLTSGGTLKCRKLKTTENVDVEMKDDSICKTDDVSRPHDFHTLPTIKSNRSAKNNLNEKEESGSIKVKTCNDSSEERQGSSVDSSCVTGSDTTMLSGTFHKTDSRKGGKTDGVQDKVSVGAGCREPGNSVQDRGPLAAEAGRRGSEKTPSSDSRYGKEDRQRMLSGENQRFLAGERLQFGEGKRRHSEEPRYRRESNPSLQNRGSIDSTNQDKRGGMQRSQSDSTQEITPKTAQTYREYREAKQRQLEREEREKKRNQMRPSSTEKPNGYSMPRKDSVKKLDDLATPSNPLIKGGQTSSSISTISDTLESQFCIVYGADLPSPQETSDRLSDYNIDLDDSDDELLETPSFLKDLENAITQPVPGTPPPKNQLSPGPGSPIPMVSNNSIFIPSTSRFAKFSLDSLLAEQTDKPEEQREFEEMHAELKESVRKGGFVKDTLEKQEDHAEQNLLPEHQEQIEHLEMKKSVISTAHPGETIFCASRFKQLYTSRISPTMCGFIPGESFIDKFLSTVQPKDFGTLLSSEVLVSSLEKVSCPKILLKWLIFLLSVDESHLVMDGCFKVLEEYLYCHKVFLDDQDDPWAPCIEDLLSVFMNCGASEESILPRDVFKDDKELSSIGTKVTRESSQPLPPPNADSFNRENLRMVIQVLALALQRKPKYQTSHLLALYVMLCRVALDKSLNCGLINVEIQSCLGSILCCYSASEWKTEALQLCTILPTLTDHHHNKAYLASLSPYGKRGQFLQRRVAYIMLRQLFDLEPCSTEKLENCKIRDLHQFLPPLQNLVNTDMYKLYSCISLVDLSVGNGLITPAEKDSLQYLSDQIKKICGDTRDDVRMLDRSRVKDQMVRLTSKWTLMLLRVGSKQRSIFSYTSSRAPQSLTIETVQTTQSDESQSEQESDEDLDPLENIDLDPTEMPADDISTETPADDA